GEDLLEAVAPTEEHAHDRPVPPLAQQLDGVVEPGAHLVGYRRKLSLHGFIVPHRPSAFCQSRSFTASAARRFIPGTAASSSTLAARIASMLPKCLSRARRRRGPIPGMSSRTERTDPAVRRRRW